MGSRIVHHIEVDMGGLDVRQGTSKDGKVLREAVQFLLNDGALDHTGRIVRNGKVLE